MRNILVGGAWPYANGSLHLGHIAGLLPGDVIARYHRAIGDNVYFVSGSDCHGTPVAIRAKHENKSPQEVSDYYHEEFKNCFEQLGFSYDVYTKTSSEEHKNFVRQFHKKLYKSNYVYEKEAPQAYCDCCNTFLADRFVTGKCPECGNDTRGDQCDFCGTVLEPEGLIEPVCAVCGNRISFKSATHLYIAISKLEKQLKELVNKHPNWRKNAISFTNRYINEGLKDRALTRDLNWGIDVPKEGFEDKKIYIWAENVLGYLSASQIAAEQNGDEYEKIWGVNAKHYYVHGKDNIPFWIGPRGVGIDGATFIPPAPEVVIELLNNLYEYMNDAFIDPLLINVAISHAQFETIHAYKDGNGRLGRALIPIQMAMLEEGKPILYLSELIELYKPSYQRNLMESRRGNLVGFIKFFLQCVNDQCMSYINKINRIKRIYNEDMKKIESLRGNSVYKIMPVIMRQIVFTKKEVEKESGVSVNVVSNIINKLVEMEILVKDSAVVKKGYRYQRIYEVFVGNKEYY